MVDSMEKILIKMVDGGLVNFEDDCYYYGGCPTCDYGSEYITEIDVTLTHCLIHIETNKMYDYVISEGQMMRLLLSEYNTIQTMTEDEFVDWFKEKIYEIAGNDNYIKRFEVDY